MTAKVMQQIERAYQQVRRSQVVSTTVYGFELDRQILHIEDRDFVFVGHGQSSTRYAYPLTMPVKSIRPSARRVVQGVHCLPEEFSADALLRGAPVKGAQLIVENKGALKQVLLDLGSEHEIRAGSKFLLTLIYQVPMKRKGNTFIFSGAIQPSDYAAARQVLGIESASKTLLISAYQSSSFEASIFNPAEESYFPKPIIATEDRGVFVVKHRIEKESEDWGRATYFAISVPNL